MSNKGENAGGGTRRGRSRGGVDSVDGIAIPVLEEGHLFGEHKGMHRNEVLQTVGYSMLSVII